MISLKYIFQGEALTSVGSHGEHNVGFFVLKVEPDSLQIDRTNDKLDLVVMMTMACEAQTTLELAS